MDISSYDRQSTCHGLINVAQLISQYYTLQPEINNNDQAVRFGTSGHRGSASHHNFNEAHVLAISQALAEERYKLGITGPCYVGKDTHALSEPAFLSVLEVLTANGVDVIVQTGNGYTPTPAISRAILMHNYINDSLADGIVITSSHNPPEDGGIKYNMPNGGSANTNITQMIEGRANALLAGSLRAVKRLTPEKAWRSVYIHFKDLVQPYIEGLSRVVNMKAIKQAGIQLGVDPLGGSGISYWQRIAEYYQLNLKLVNEDIDQTFRFIHSDYDGVIRMDCSSELAMMRLLALRNKFDLAFANDPDHDRHSIVTPAGLMNSNHYLAVAIHYLFQNRPQWKSSVKVGKTLVSSTMIDRVVDSLNRQLIETPVGFKWFANGLFNGTVGFGGEESAGASFLCFDCHPWSTDKDGIIMCLLAAEIFSVTGQDPQQYYNELEQHFGIFSYNRAHVPATRFQKTALSKFFPEQMTVNVLAGDPITTRLTVTPDSMPISSLKMITKNGWFAIRPSGTEETYKIYCESFLSTVHCQQIEIEALDIVKRILKQ